MQQLLPLHLVTIGVGLAWLIQRRDKTVKPSDSSQYPANEPAAHDGSKEEDFERSATQWLSRNGAGCSNSASAQLDTVQSSSYSEVELLCDGELVYLRCDGNILTALVPVGRHLSLQPLQLTKGKPDAVPTAPLEPNSVWRVRRCKQQLVFELQGPHHRTHVLDADPHRPHGVALGGGSGAKRARWLISPQGLTSARWPQLVLPLQVVPVQLVDARAVGSLKAGLGRRVSELSAQLDAEVLQRQQAEARAGMMQAELRTARQDAAAQVSELRSQLEAAMRARAASEREVAALQSQMAEEVARTRAALTRAAQAEHAAQQADATVRRQQQQIQGMLAGHAEELRTLHQELQIARETNQGLKRAMSEQVVSLQSALELRDARILELEEDNDRMDTVLQVIQAQLGEGDYGINVRSTAGRNHMLDGASGSNSAHVGASRAGRSSGGGSAGETGAFGKAAITVLLAPEAGDGSAADAAARGGGSGGREPSEVMSLTEIVRQSVTTAAAAVAASDMEPPLWRSLLELTGDISVTALKESLAMSRRTTTDDAPVAPTGISPVALQPNQLPPHHRQRQFDKAVSDLPLTAHRSGDSMVSSSSVGSTSCAQMTTTISADCGAGGIDLVSVADSNGGGNNNGPGVESATKVLTTMTTTAAAAIEETETEFVSAAMRMTGRFRRGVWTLDVAGASGVLPPLPPLSQQERRPLQVPGAAGGGVGGCAVRRGEVDPSVGGVLDLAGACGDAAAAQPGAPNRGLSGARGASAGSGPRSGPLVGCSPAQLQHGLETTLTLDSLRRRMRQLDAERERLHLLHTSLRKSLPWRSGGSACAGGEEAGEESGSSRLGVCVGLLPPPLRGQGEGGGWRGAVGDSGIMEGRGEGEGEGLQVGRVSGMGAAEGTTGRANVDRAVSGAWELVLGEPVEGDGAERRQAWGSASGAEEDEQRDLLQQEVMELSLQIRDAQLKDARLRQVECQDKGGGWAIVEGLTMTPGLPGARRHQRVARGATYGGEVRQQQQLGDGLGKNEYASTLLEVDAIALVNRSSIPAKSEGGYIALSKIHSMSRVGADGDGSSMGGGGGSGLRTPVLGSNVRRIQQQLLSIGGAATSQPIPAPRLPLLSAHGSTSPAPGETALGVLQDNILAGMGGVGGNSSASSTSSGIIPPVPLPTSDMSGMQTPDHRPEFQHRFCLPESPLLLPNLNAPRGCTVAGNNNNNVPSIVAAVEAAVAEAQRFAASRSKTLMTLEGHNTEGVDLLTSSWLRCEDLIGASGVGKEGSRLHDGAEPADACADVLEDDTSEYKSPQPDVTVVGTGDDDGCIVRVGSTTTASGVHMPQLLINNIAPLVETYSFYDSIDGMCNLGSTRAQLTARGGGGSGFSTARRVGQHSRQPSAGAAAAATTATTTTGVLGLVPSSVDQPRTQTLHLGDIPPRPPSCSPLRQQPGGVTSGTATPGQVVTAPPSATSATATGTPTKSYGSTPRCGDMGGEDDAAVHCDDQGPSPPGPMLLGPLEVLRGAAAAVMMGSSAGGGVVRAGERALAALEEDEEE